MSHIAAKLFMSAALLGVGGLCGAALTTGRGAAPTSIAAADTPQGRPPVEVRTIVKRRTIHVYRKPKHHAAPPAPAPAPAPVAVAPPAATAAPAPAPAVTRAPVRTSSPLTTRTSGSGHGSGHEREGSDDHGEHEGGDD